MLLTGLHIVIMGGDARQIEVIRKLSELGTKISLVGYEQLDHSFTGAVKEKIDEINWQEIDAIILPVAGTSLDGEIDTIFSIEHIRIDENKISKTPPHCTIYSGITNTYLTKITQKAGRKLELIFDRNDVAIYNSIPTVEGIIMLVIQNTDFTIHGSKTVVLGFGRNGMTISRVFHGLGAKLKVGARNAEHIARIEEMGLDSFHLNDLEEIVKDADIVINTIPHLVVTANVISKMPHHTLIIDIASKPGGTDFRYAEKRGIKAILTPSLPGIVAPKTAGQILANVLVELLYDDLLKRKGNVK